MKFKKKYLFLNLIKSKCANETHTFNYKKHIQNNVLDHNLKGKLISIFLIKSKSNKFYLEELSGILLKVRKNKYLSSIHLVLIRKYNNIYVSYILNESPIVYNIKILE